MRGKGKMAKLPTLLAQLPTKPTARRLEPTTGKFAMLRGGAKQPEMDNPSSRIPPVIGQQADQGFQTYLKGKGKGKIICSWIPGTCSSATL
jgi:hypothetical protein